MTVAVTGLKLRGWRLVFLIKTQTEISYEFNILKNWMEFAKMHLESVTQQGGSSDLNSSIFVWSHLKSLLYETPEETSEDLIARINGRCSKNLGNT
ncbi:hypothetical protein AVEN_14387-1 [Araneus ventricosus]|uniref:Uncharacterized protein n=1 Tax=Araneus ventricosus TaxID=182803 RepID=A0A4Y2M190_ARAVE|nr:hypothetical protein AVEN_14387-1 [Araneus ventricosus]